jgi:hypothetical protein
MKTHTTMILSAPLKCRLLPLLTFLLIATAFTCPAPEKNSNAPELTGAWRLTSKPAGPLAGATAVKIVTEGRFTVAYYDQAGKRFMGTYGGTYTVSGGQLTEKLDFSTLDSTLVGKSGSLTHGLRNGIWTLTGARGSEKVSETWKKMEEKMDGTSLAGTWQIRQREGEGGGMTTIKPGPRQTIKFLSGNRFQWVAFNNETRQFFGTGGGTYTAKDGKYTESIEFFSRDPARVGMQLSFDYELNGNQWHHSGSSSTGNRVNEIWEKE